MAEHRSRIVPRQMFDTWNLFLVEADLKGINSYPFESNGFRRIHHDREEFLRFEILILYFPV